jgi:hypothetical protein
MPDDKTYRATITKEEAFGLVIRDVDGTEELETISDLLPLERNIAGETFDEVELPKVEGETALSESVRTLCRRLSRLFRRYVSKDPAKGVPPMKLEVDVERWRKDKATSNFCRPQSLVKEIALKEHILKMLELGLIEPSDAENFSQVHLTPKPDGSWRFCIDYRLLNACSTTNAGLPLPNIKVLLQRLGTKNAKFYGKLDLTSGFHQSELHDESRDFAAFIALGKVYRPTRVQMGLKNAPSYFQRIIALKVLRELVGEICEVYIDDIIIWGVDEVDYLNNLKTVFERLQEHNITVNPRKVELCLTEVEFLGHLLRPYGITMSEKKIQKVINFAKPQTLTELNSFLGLANYFRDFVPNYSEVTRPLREMGTELNNSLPRKNGTRKLTKSQKNTALQWSAEALASWEATKEAIMHCETLHFLKEKGKIILYTDASDYGYGAYLCQEDENGITRPVGFMSHSFNDTQMRWATYDKEGYAIFKAFQEFRLFIRDRKFTLKTDHLNLIYVGSETSSAKVQRWKLFMQDYDFDIEHVPGEQNVIADGLSRFLSRREVETTPAAKVNLLAALFSDRKPTEEQRKWMEAIHNEVCGHHGVERSIQMLQDVGHTWPGMRGDVRNHIRHCAICQKLDYSRPEVHPIPMTLACLRPHQRLYMDTIGPLQPSVDDKRKEPYLHILVIIDAFTRYVTLFPLETLSAPEAADCLDAYFVDKTVPEAVVSDQGTQFINGIFDEYFKRLGIQRPDTLAHNHEDNGIVERANKEVMRHLRAFIYARRVRDTWHKYLPHVQKIMNLAPSRITKKAPLELQNPSFYADSVERGEYLAALAVDREEPAQTAWVKRTVAYAKDVLELAAQIQADVDAEHLAKLEDMQPTTFADGTWVLAMPHRGRGDVRAQDMKTKSFWSGPYQVLSHLGNTYVVKDVIQDLIKEYHVTSLKEFLFDPETTDPRKIACGDSQEFHVERVIEHAWRMEGEVNSTAQAGPSSSDRKKRKKRSDLFFKIRWLGFDETEDTWEPWKGVMHVDVVKDYCEQHAELRSYVKDK